MKNLISILFFFLLSVQTIFSQWYVQYTHSFPLSLYSVHFYDNNTGWTVGSSTNVFKTTDGGITWFEYATGSNASPMTDIFFIDNNLGWVVGTIGNIYKTTDGGVNWSNQSLLGEYVFESVCFIDSVSGWITGYYYNGSNWEGRILNTSDGGSNWSIQLNSNINLRSVYFKDANKGWTVGEFGFVFKTTDGGNMWNSQQITAFYHLNTVVFVDDNTGWIVGDNGNIFKSTDSGDNWIGQQSGTLSDLNSVFFVDNYIGWTVGESGIILYTTNGGNNWVIQESGITNRLWSVYFTNNLVGWIVGEGGIVLHTVNGGIPVELTLFTASVNDNHVTLNWLTATELNNSGFEILRFTQNDINGWEKIGFVPGSGTTTEPRSYSFVDSDLEPGNYSYRLKQIDYDGTFEYSEEVEVEVSSLAPVEYALEQNYPNPFNPVTIIKYNLPVKNLITLKVYNLLGEEVTTLVNEIKEAGNYEIEFNAASLSSGIYFYSINAGEYTATKKMVLLK